MVTGDEARLSSGPCIDAVLASAAIPGILPPVPWNSKTLIDGGVANNTPIRDAIELGADEIYVLATGSTCALDEPPSGALGMVAHATSLLVQRQLDAELELLGGRENLIILPPPCPYRVQPMDFGHADELIEQALRASRSFLAGRDRAHPHATRRAA